MAFRSAAGHGNLPNGNFSSVIYSEKVQLSFREKAVVEAVTNSDYFGEIANKGDSVEIIKEPDITVRRLDRGTQLESQALNDDNFTLVVDQANYFQFEVDDIEAKHSHVNFMDLATDRAAFNLANLMDKEVFAYLSGWTYDDTAGTWSRNTTANGTKADNNAGSDELLAANKLDITDFGGSDVGSSAEVTAIPLAAGGGSSGITSPLAVLNRIKRLFDQANVPQEDRWFVADPVFFEVLEDEDSKLINADFVAGDVDVLRNGLRTNRMIRGMKAYMSNNLPRLGSGAGVSASAGSETNFGVLVAGHTASVATAQQLAKTESFRSPNGFADVVRGMHLYGRKILRPEAIFTANYCLA